MLVFIIFGLFLFTGLKDYYAKKKAHKNSYVRFPQKLATAVFLGILSTALLIALLTSTIMLKAQTFDLRKQEALIPQKTHQKEELIKLVRNELSADQLKALVEATSIDSVLVILGNPAGPAAQILEDRANSIVGLTNQINTLRNKVDSTKIDICNGVDNIFVPRIPFFNIDCNYDFSPSN